MQIPSITIEQVAQQFKAWRQTKTNKFDPIPNRILAAKLHNSI
ncbi:hypothetical protein [Candidatus Tisiphia endosymbiont of Hybos culiciformis]